MWLLAPLLSMRRDYGLTKLPLDLLLSHGKTHWLLPSQSKHQWGLLWINVCSNLALQSGFSGGKLGCGCVAKAKVLRPMSRKNETSGSVNAHRNWRFAPLGYLKKYPGIYVSHCCAWRETFFKKLCLISVHLSWTALIAVHEERMACSRKLSFCSSRISWLGSYYLRSREFVFLSCISSVKGLPWTD